MSKKVSPDSRLVKKPVRKSPKKEGSRSKKRGESQQGSGNIYRALIENFHEVLFSIDLQGRFTYINPVIEQLTGYKVDQVIGGSFERFIYPDDLPGLTSSFKRTLADQPESYEFRILDGDGKILYMRSSSHLIQEEGKAVGLTGVMVEITKLKQTEQALLEAEAKFHTLVEQIPAAVYTDAIDDGSSTVYFSPQIEKLTGYSPEEWIADPALWSNIIHPEDREMVLAEHQETNQTGERFLIEYRLIARDGRVVWVRDEATILHDSKGKAICWQGVMLDISEQKQAEVALRQRAEELAAFRATVLDLAGQQDLLSLLRTIVERSMTLLKAPNGFIYLYDATTNDLELIVELGFPVTPGVRLKMGEGMVGWVAQNRQTLIVDDYSTWEGRSPLFTHIPYHTVIEVPMLFGGQLIGVLGVNDSIEMKCTFTEADAQLLLLFAGQAASAVHDARLVQGLQMELTERKRVEDSLREAEARFRALVEQIPAIVYTDSAEQIGQTHYISPQILTIMGYDPEEWAVNNDLWNKVIHPDDRERVLAEYNQTYETGKPFTAEYRMTSNAGQIVWVRDEAVLIRDQSGRPMFWQGIMHDITERKQAEVALEESEERYRRLFDLSPDAIVVHRGGEILLANTAAMIFVGAATPEEIIGKPMLDFVHPDYRKLVIERTQHQIAEGKVVPVTEEKFIRLDGTVIDVEVTSAPVHYRDTLVSLVIFRDISERKIAEAALEESEAKYRNVVERANDGITIIKDGIVKFANPRLVQLAGRSLAEIIGSPMSDYIHPDELPNVVDRYNRRMAGEELPSAYETVLIHKNKTKLYVELNAGAIQYEGGIADLVIVRDISERKLAESALKDSEISYQGLFNRVSEAIYIQDREGHFLDVNEGAVKMYGYPREYLIGKTPADVSAPEKNDLKKIKEMFRKAFKDQPQQFEFWGKRSNGEIFPKDIRLYKGIYFGQDVVIALAQDITQRKLAEEALQRQLKELTVLHAVSMTATQVSSVDQLIEQVTRIIGNAVYVDDFGVALFDQASQVLRPHPSYHGETFEAMATIPLSEGIMGYVASSGEPYCTSDVRNDEHYLNTVPETLSELCVPIKVGKKLIGVINAESRQLNFFKEDDERLLNTIAGTLATAIEKLHLFDAEHVRRQEAETLREAAAAVSSSLELNQVLNTILISLKRVVPYDSASVTLLEGEHLRLVAVQGFDHPEKIINQTFSANDDLFRETQKMNKPIFLADAKTDARFHQWAWTGHVRGWMGVPLIVRKKVIGYITLDSHEPSAYHEESAALVQAFAHQVATAIENARLYEAEQRRLQESETLREAAAVVASTLDQNHAVQLILDQLARVVPYDSASVLIMREGYLEIIGGQGWEDPSAVIGLHFPIPGDNPNTLVVQQRSPVILGNAPRQYAVFRNKPHNHIMSWLGVPMIVRDRVIGILSIDSKQPDYFTQESIRLVSAFASQAASTIENARLYEEAIQAAERRAILHRASQEIASASQDPEQVYAAVHRAAGQMMPAKAFAITLLEEQSQETIGVYLVDKGGRAPIDRVPAGVGLSGLVISTGRPVITNDLTVDPIPGSVHFGEEEEVRSILAVPLRLGEKVIGMLSVQSYEPHAYTDDDQALLEMLAAHAAVAIENARLYAETLQRLKELEAVNHISTALRSAQTVDDMLPSLLEETLQVLGSDSGVIWLYDPVGGVLKEKVARGWFTTIQETPVKPGEGIAGTVFKTGQVSVSKEFASDPLTRESTRDRLPIGWGGACVPIRTMRETIGVLFVSVELPRQLQADAVHLLVTLSEMAGNAIRRATLHEQTERQLQRLASLRAVDMAINTILDLRVTLGILIDHIISQLKVDAVNILLINPNTPTLYHAASSGFRSDAFKNTRLYISDSLAGQAIRTRTTTHIPDLSESKLLQRVELQTEEGFVTYFGVPLIAKGQIKGVLEIFHRSPLEPDSEWRSFLETLAGQAAIAIDNSVLFEELQQTNMNLSLAYDATIEGWSKALDLRDQGTEGHTLRVAEMTVLLADIMGVSSVDLVHVRRGALLHDIGKMGIPDSILIKTGPLTDEEWVIMHRHPDFAFEMISPITYLRQALDIPYGHHERWDGSGYPRHLAGEQIPLAARIFAVVDVWDALISDRPYRKALTKAAAAEFVRVNSGKLFDPRVVEAFLQMIAKDQARPVV
jgi:PAS domain S-box-containing protein/putative nucleotidyltransferase with HDIG domain